MVSTPHEDDNQGMDWCIGIGLGLSCTSQVTPDRAKAADVSNLSTEI